MTDPLRREVEGWKGLTGQAVRRLAGRRPRRGQVAPSCTLRRAVGMVFDLSGEAADALCRLFELDPTRTVRKPS